MKEWWKMICLESKLGFHIGLGLRVSWGHWTLDETESERVRVLAVYVPQ